MNRTATLALLALSALHVPVIAAEIILPHERTAYYASEPIEIAIAALPGGEKALVSLVPQGTTAAAPVEFSATGDGSTLLFELPAGALAPGSYDLRLDGQPAGKLTIASGVNESTLLLSQTVGMDQLKDGGANFVLGNAFSFGRLAPGGSGPRTTDLRAGRSPGLSVFDRAIEINLPSVVYMYWTGYVTHKPFGSKKSWAAADMTDAMRLLSFHTAQRVRRFAPNVVSVGTLDEPGLGWGKTPAGGTASGFPDWDEEAWYAARGWQFTNDPGARPDDDWLKYMTIRTAIMAEQQGQAKQDLKHVWPEMVFSTDLYAPHAIMDGTDPLAQAVNDIPSSHVFVDWGIDRLGAYSGVALEKAHDPLSRLAHAMNGQLFSEPVPQPQQSYAYRAALNGMLAAGLESNWWLNTGGMSPADLKAVNDPGKRIGPVLRECNLGGHDVAVLWGFSEIALREKEITAKEAAKKTGEQIKLLVASLPENSALKNKELDINAYNIGGDYKEAVLTAHYALSRAGYPAHIVHERVLPKVLASYKTLVVVGQTFPLSAEAMSAIEDFVAKGGKIVIDKSTTLALPGAIVADVDLKGLSYRWGALFLEDDKNFKSPREASLYDTNYFMDEPVRNAVAPFKAAMQQTASQPRVATESNELLIERHQAGEGFVTLLVNGLEQLPEKSDGEKYWIYNYAPQEATYQLLGLPEGAAVYALEGQDFAQASRVENPAAPIKGSFAPAEMKVYFIAPRAPESLAVAAKAEGTGLAIEARLTNLRMPWSLRVSVLDQSGRELYVLHRATSAEGVYQETIPLGANAAAEKYTVKIESPLAGLKGEAMVAYSCPQQPARQLADAVRVFDESAVHGLLAEKSSVTIVYGADAHKPLADQIAASLAAAGLKAAVQHESQVLRKVAYPRVWNPYAKVVEARGEDKPLGDRKVEHRIAAGVATDGAVSITDEAGNKLEDWKTPNSLVTVAADGLIEWNADDETCYAPGVKLYVDQNRSVEILYGEASEVRTTPEFRQRWARPWATLTSHVGAYQLPAQLPEAYTADGHLILLGDSTTSHAMAVLQASELLPQTADAKYPGPGKALVSFAWSPFAVGKNAIVLAASDEAGLKRAVERLAEIVRK